MTKDWKEHIDIDYRYCTGHAAFLVENQTLLERLGHVPDLEDTLDTAWKSIDKEELRKGVYQYCTLNTSYLKDCVVRVKYWENGAGRTLGRSVLTNAFLSEGKLREVKIEINLEGPFESACREFCRILSHELLHTFREVQRLRKKEEAYSLGDENPERFGRRPSYNEIIGLMQDPGSNLNRVVGNILYFLFPEEQGAFVGQLRVELAPHALELGTSAGCQKALEETEFWKNLQYVKRNLQKITELKKEESKEKVRVAVNKVFGREHECNTFNKALKKLIACTDRAEKKMKSLVGKICWELYNTRTTSEGKSYLDSFVDPLELDSL